MGTYDTRGGSPLSPQDDYVILDIEDDILEVLEKYEIETDYCDKIVALVREAWIHLENKKMEAL